MMMTFRQFCVEMWYAHKEEHNAWMKCDPDYTSEEYFNRYKWMLKSLYKTYGGSTEFLKSLK
jgi:hypothetical protein